MDKSYIQFRTHGVFITQHDEFVYCFKVTDRRCDWEIFPDLNSSLDYVLTPFPVDQYCLEVDTE